MRSIYQRWKKRNATPEIDLQSHCNERYLNTPQKKMKISKLRSRTHDLQKEISVLQKKIDELINMHGQQLDQDLHSVSEKYRKTLYSITLGNKGLVEDRRNEHPSVYQCIKNAPSFRLQKSFMLDPIRGNCRRKRLSELDKQTVIDNTPLPKRKRT